MNELERQEQSVEVRICPLSPLEYRWSSSCVRDANMTAELNNDYTEEQKKPFGDQLEFSVYTGPSYTLKTAWKLLGGGVFICFAGIVCLPTKQEVLPTDHLYPMMNHFYPNGRGLFQDDPSPIHISQWPEWSEEDENEVNYTRWPSHSPHLNPVEPQSDTSDGVLQHHHRSTN